MISLLALFIPFKTYEQANDCPCCRDLRTCDRERSRS